MKKIIFATTNQGKVREVKMMMEDFGVDFVTMKDAGIDIDIVEDGKTFESSAKAISPVASIIVFALIMAFSSKVFRGRYIL